MRLFIENVKGYDVHFISWLTDVIKHEIMMSINPKYIRVFDTLQSSEPLFEPRYPNTNTELDFLSSIVQGIHCIRYKEIKGGWIIYVPETLAHPSYATTIYSICKLVNYGRHGIKGYPIFTKTFNRVSAKISRYYNRYLNQFIIF